ncbi:CHASE3 domain-containing protein [Roseomonas sp. GC11]|uniref:response regulator n=1 Tax=Roseomonas sp. GC11 TaxID=2950546 RepID=UPI00210F0598|nr:response regulator [Roseomonas sp. GC11]MCQ4158390.1 CHASE3 domain-containing protein [Roseomonas sp. GC11]
MPRTLRRQWHVVITALTLLGMSGGLLVAWQLSAELRAERGAVVQGFRLGEAARSLLSAVLDAETGQRGFILTGQESYLAPYEGALVQVPAALARLRGLLASSSLGIPSPGGGGPPANLAARAARLERLERLVAEKMAELAATLALARAEGTEAARARVQTDRGRQVMQEIRALLEEILAEQASGLRRSLDAAERADDRNLLLALGGMGLALALLAGGAWLVLRGNARLRRAEAALAANGAVLQATLDHIQDGIASFDAAGQLVACNLRFFDLLDFPQALARPGTPYSAFLAIDRRRGVPVLEAPDTLRGPAGTGARLPLGHAGRELELYRNPMPDGGFVLSCLDVTRRVEAEALLRQSQKMEAVGQLTGGVAHDFNNLLQVVSANLDLMGRDLGPDHPVRRYLGHAISALARGARLTAQLLAFARRQPLDPRVLNPGRLVQDMADLLRRTLGERIAVEAVVAAGQWNALVDPGQLENALLNLALNARDAMPEGGKLTIEVGNSVLDQDYAGAHLEVEPGSYVMIAVSDTGSGMTPEVAARAYEPFFTTKGEGRGTGLGLSQVYGFVKQSGGHLKIYSEPGQGTTVKLYLPRSLAAEEVPGGGVPGPVMGGTETVLVVEDDAEVREAVVEMLQDLGYRVLRAENAEAALTVVSSGVQVDLLFTDVVMPGPLPTREMVRRAQGQLPGMKVIYTSGYTANAIIHDGRLDREVQLLSKPYRREELARQVRRALGPARPGAARRRGDAVAAPLPAGASSALAAPQPEGGGQGAGWPEGSVALVVEDDPLILMNLVQMVEMLGFQVVEAGRADRALAWMATNPPPAVLITDLSLPGMDGVALAVEARRRCPGLPVLLASGHAESSVEIPPELREGMGFLAKPFAMMQLEDALRGLRERVKAA